MVCKLAILFAVQVDVNLPAHSHSLSHSKRTDDMRLDENELEDQEEESEDEEPSEKELDEEESDEAVATESGRGVASARGANHGV